MKKVWQSLALLVVTLLLCFVIGEATVRIFYFKIGDYNLEMWRYASKVKVRTPDPDLPFEHGANRKGDFYGVQIVTNSFGFRDHEYPVARVPGKQRIVMLGDSFALGWGVPFDSTFSKRLERLMNDNGRPTEVINLGVGNYNTVMELALFQQKGLQFNPDAVVLMYYVNDAETTPPVVSPLKTAILTRSYLLAFLSDRYIKLKPVIDHGYDWKAYYSNLYRDGEAGAAASRKALDDLSALCRAHGIKLYFASIPELRELKNYPFPQITEFVRSAATQDSVPFIDLRPSMIDEEPASLWVSAGDPHASVKANGIMAGDLYRAISADLPPLHDSTSAAGTRPPSGRGARRP